MITKSYGGTVTNMAFSQLSREDMELFLEHNYDLIVDGWVEAVSNGWDDLVFVWQLEGEDLKHLCVPRLMALEAFHAESQTSGSPVLPEETNSQLGQPAGEGKAWLIFIAQNWVASMCIECLQFEDTTAPN